MLLWAAGVFLLPLHQAAADNASKTPPSREVSITQKNPQAFFKGKANEDAVNVRSDSTVGSSILGTLNKDETVIVVGDNFNWYKIVLPVRFTYYIAAGYTQPINRNTIKVKATILNIRAQPSLESPIIGKAKQGEELTLAAVHEEWLTVQGAQTVFGWVHKKFITLIPAVPEAETKNKADTPLAKTPEQTSSITLEGKILPLEPIPECNANYKLKNQFSTFFLKFSPASDQPIDPEKTAVVTGSKKESPACSYIEADTVTFNQ